MERASRLGRIHRVFDQRFVDVIALRAFKGAQISMGGHRFDPGLTSCGPDTLGNGAARSGVALVRNNGQRLLLVGGCNAKVPAPRPVGALDSN